MIFVGKPIRYCNCLVAFFVLVIGQGEMEAMEPDLAKLGFKIEIRENPAPLVFLEDSKLTPMMSEMLAETYAEIAFLSLRNVSIERDALSTLLTKTHCHSIFVERVRVKDSNQWLALRHQQELESIDLDRTRLPDEFEKLLHQLPSLREFFIRNCKNFAINGSWAGNDDVNVIWIENSPVGDDFVRSLSGLKALRHVTLLGADLNDQSVAVMGPMVKLESLSVGDNQLSKLPPEILKSNQLESFGGRNTALSLEVLRELADLPNLKSLGASWKGMSEFEELAIRFVPRKSYEQRELIPEFRELGGEIDINYCSRKVIIRFDEAKNVDASVADFESLDFATRDMSFRNSDLSDDGLAALLASYEGRLADEIHSIDIAGTHVTEAGFRKLLKMCKAIQTVSYGGVLGEETLAALVKSNVQDLRLFGSPVSNAMVAALQEMKQLNSITLHDCEVTHQQEALLRRTIKEFKIE